MKGGFKKSQHIPRNLEGHTHVEGCACAQKSPEKAPQISSLANINVKEVKAKAGL